MPARPLTLQDLKSDLWNCAQILRGSAIDRTDWKGYILPLLFFKRISDVWDEETAEAREEYGDIDLGVFRELHRFTLPDGCHWRDVRERPTNVGAALARAMRAIKRANPDTLTRVFASADWGNREMLGDELLKDLIEGLSGVPLGNTGVGSDILGDAYEYVIGKFADITRRKKAGEFYTPRSVVRMMVELLNPQEGESIYDPACGTGGMLLGATDHVERAGGDPRTFFGRIFGEEKNLTTSSIARMNLVLHGVEDFRIEQNDTLRNPAFTDPTGALATFDCVIANPPFSLKEWGREVWEADPWGRAAFGLPPASYGDYAWVQQMVASMAEYSGRMAVVLPQGALFRKGAEGRIRRALLEQDLIEAVIGLAPKTANPERQAGVFGNAPWTDKAQMPDATLKNLIEALLEAHAEPRRGARGRAGQCLRVPHQAVRRRQRPHGARVLHQPDAGAPDDSDAPAAAGRAHLRSDGRHGRHAHLRAGRGAAQRRRRSDAWPLRTGDHRHDGVHRAHEPRAARRRGLPDRSRQRAERSCFRRA